MKYNSEWNKLSKQILQTKPNCVLCEIRGIEKPAEQVHHCIKPDKQLEDGLQDLLLTDEDNLIPVCKSCHNKIHKQPWFIWPEQRQFIDNKKNEICKKYLEHGLIVMWTQDENGVRKNRF